MNTLLILSIAVALAMDSLSATLALSLKTKGQDKGIILKMAASFGLFQGIMPVLGWYSGTHFVHYLQDIDHWVGFGLLTAIGLHMIWDSIRGKKSLKQEKAPEIKPLHLFMLSVGTSIDAFAVGLSFASLGQSIWMPALLFGAVTFFLCTSAGILGQSLSKIIGKKAEMLGGGILLIIGIKILIDHL